MGGWEKEREQLLSVPCCGGLELEWGGRWQIFIFQLKNAVVMSHPEVTSLPNEPLVGIIFNSAPGFRVASYTSGSGVCTCTWLSKASIQT